MSTRLRKTIDELKLLIRSRYPIIYLVTFEEAVQALEMFGSIRIYGYNPLPGLLSLFPRKLVRRVPGSWNRFLSVPSPILARVPGIEGLMRRLMQHPQLRKLAKAFIIEAEK